MRALRYNPELVRTRMLWHHQDDPPAQQEELYQASPYNIIRLELGKEEPGDDEARNRYTRAKETLDAWRKEGVLILDEVPSFYVYEQEFTVEGKTYQRRGIFGRLRLIDFAEGIVLPHEETLSGPKADRNQLLEATQTNLSPIFGLVADQERKIGQMMDEVCREAPIADFQGFEGIRERLWQVSDPALCQQITTAFGPEKIILQTATTAMKLPWPTASAILRQMQL